jgi:hypothetical protein
MPFPATRAIVVDAARYAKQTHNIQGIALPLYTLNALVGSIAAKPGVVAGRIEIRECLSLTLGFDRDRVDGAPAACLAQRFTNWSKAAMGSALKNRSLGSGPSGL